MPKVPNLSIYLSEEEEEEEEDDDDDDEEEEEEGEETFWDNGKHGGLQNRRDWFRNPVAVLRWF